MPELVLAMVIGVVIGFIWGTNRKIRRMCEMSNLTPHQLTYALTYITLNQAVRTHILDIAARESHEPRDYYSEIEDEIHIPGRWPDGPDSGRPGL